MENKDYTGLSVMTSKGQGKIQRHKPGNFLNQDFLVQFPSGKTHWFAEKEFSFIDQKEG